MDSYYEYIWDVTILEYLTCILLLEYPTHILDVHSWEKSITYPSDFSWLILRSPPQKRRDRQEADSSKLTQAAGISLESFFPPEITSETVVSIPVLILSYNCFRIWVLM